eukprot:TRINITY_DN25115_c0_g1_i1.p1 TRINITY_DN25115_c0_g1~~TRINITY_DN25115_c0_g1_i1.p1  ORF type:complete len:190 (+),score=14.27 TRINITY_DN25115_c0_g1_i1:42-572(+)
MEFPLRRFICAIAPFAAGILAPVVAIRRENSTIPRLNLRCVQPHDASCSDEWYPGIKLRIYCVNVKSAAYVERGTCEGLGYTCKRPLYLNGSVSNALNYGVDRYIKPASNGGCPQEVLWDNYGKKMHACCGPHHFRKVWRPCSCNCDDHSREACKAVGKSLDQPENSTSAELDSSS